MAATAREERASAGGELAVQVVDEASGEALVGADVWYVGGGFEYNRLTVWEQECYSRNTEAYLRESGRRAITGREGIAWVPEEAGKTLMCARFGRLYGRGATGVGERHVVIAVSVHSALVVRVVDAAGAPVAGVRILGGPLDEVKFGFPRAKPTLGRTDANGRVEQAVKATGSRQPWSIAAELIDREVGRQTVDLGSGGDVALEIALPDTGIVEARVVDARGRAIAEPALKHMHAVLYLQDDATKSARCELEADGTVVFRNVPLGKIVAVKFPPAVTEGIVLDGPREDCRSVQLVKTLDPEHPLISGVLCTPTGDLIPDKQMTIMCNVKGALVATLAARSDTDGRFISYLPDRCLGLEGAVISVGIEWHGTGPGRAAQLPVKGVLRGSVELGRVAVK